MAYAIKKGSDYMKSVLWTGNGTTQDVDVGWNPGLTFTRNRTDASGGSIYDIIRGDTEFLQSTNTNVPASDSGNDFEFITNGFTVNNNGNIANISTKNFVGWNWKGGESTVENTDGTITSQVSANPTSGFSVVKWTGTGSAGTIGHGLSATPQFIIVKNLTYGVNWRAYHVASGGTKYYSFNSNNAEGTSSLPWNNTAPTSSVFSVGTEDNTNRSSDEFIAYVWAPVAGYSKFGYYTGNGSTDGPFVYTGFRPAYIMIKRTVNAGGSWVIHDSSRNTYNVADLNLYANVIDGENSDAVLDFTSNGFKIRTTRLGENWSGDTFIYMAFAETSFKYSNAR